MIGKGVAPRWCCGTALECSHQCQELDQRRALVHLRLAESAVTLLPTVVLHTYFGLGACREEPPS